MTSNVAGRTCVVNLFLTTVIVVSLTAVSAAPTITAVPTPAWMTSLAPVAEGGVRFLKSQYNANLGLLQESPTIRPNNYFLANDPLLAALSRRMD